MAVSYEYGVVSMVMIQKNSISLASIMMIGHMTEEMIGQKLTPFLELEPQILYTPKWLSFKVEKMCVGPCNQKIFSVAKQI